MQAWSSEIFSVQHLSKKLNEYQDMQAWSSEIFSLQHLSKKLNEYQDMQACYFDCLFLKWLAYSHLLRVQANCCISNLALPVLISLKHSRPSEMFRQGKSSEGWWHGTLTVIKSLPCTSTLMSRWLHSWTDITHQVPASWINTFIYCDLYESGEMATHQSIFISSQHR
jgi:hypothetical protein